MEAFGRVPQGVAQASGGGGSGHVARYTQLVRRTLGFQSEPLAQVEMLVCVYVRSWGVVRFQNLADELPPFFLNAVLITAVLFLNSECVVLFP